MTGSGRAHGAALAAALVAMVAAAYVPVWSAGWIWDDDDYVTENAVLEAPDGIARLWTDPAATPQYYPLVYTTFWLEHHLWQERPLGYHLVNLALHALGSLLLWRLLVRLRVPGAWVAAAIFAVHPVHVESVAWVTERKNVLSGVFYFASFGAYLRWSPPGGETPPGPRRFYVLALAAFAAALLSKTSTVTLPAAVLLVLWWKRGRLRPRDVVPVLPFLALAAASGLMTVWVETHHVGAQGAEWSLSPLERILVAGRALWFYAGKLVAPVRLSIIHPRWHPDAAGAWQLAYPAAAVGVIAALAFLRRRTGNAPLAGVLFFAGTLAPVLGFVNVYFFRYSFVADHFQYLPSVGLIALGTAAVTRGVRRFAPAARVTLAAVVLLALGTLTWRQASVYRDEETLWRHTLRVNPDAWMAHNNLGLLLVARGDIDEALRHYDAAVARAPGVAEPYDNRGLVYYRRGDFERAIRDFDRCLERAPDHVQAYINRAAAYADLGRYDESVRDCDTAIAKVPRSAPAYYNRAATFRKMGDPDRALADYDRALELVPGWAQAHKGRGDVLYGKGRFAEAVESYSRALTLDPRLHGARNGRAAAFLQLGDFDSARADLELCRSFGGTPSPQLVAALRRVTGR